MKLNLKTIAIAGLAGPAIAASASIAAAQGNWKEEPAPPPPVNIASIPVDPPPPKPIGKQRPARPSGDPSLWVTNGDYPAVALRDKHQGNTGFRLTISPTGKVISCDITASSGFSSLDQTTCRVAMQRARFFPALNKNGKPTTGTWVGHTNWLIPDDGSLPAPSPFSSTISFIIEADGLVSNCTGTGKYADMSGEIAPCGTGARYQPYRDPTGKPVRRRVIMSVSFDVTDPDAPLQAAAPAVPTQVPH